MVVRNRLRGPNNWGPGRGSTRLRMIFMSDWQRSCQQDEAGFDSGTGDNAVVECKPLSELQLRRYCVSSVSLRVFGSIFWKLGAANELSSERVNALRCSEAALTSGEPCGVRLPLMWGVKQVTESLSACGGKEDRQPLALIVRVIVFRKWKSQWEIKS